MSGEIKSERELIAEYFAPLAAGFAGAYALVDDAACITPPEGCDLVVSTDPIRAGVHFFADDDPADIAWKALAVNVSDVVAKGAEPFAYTMALSFPHSPQRDWVERFAHGLQQAQDAFGCQLAGGDTDRAEGPVSVAVTMFGIVERGRFVSRNGVQPGDHIFVSGTIGDAELGLALRRNPHAFPDIAPESRQALLQRYLRPTPRPQLIDALKNHALAAIDVSDGLLRDIANLASGLGLDVVSDQIPLSPAGKTLVQQDPGLWRKLLAGGDYEIVAVVSPQNRAAFMEEARSSEVAVTDLGRLSQQGQVRLVDGHGAMIDVGSTGFDHLSAGGND